MGRIIIEKPPRVKRFPIEMFFANEEGILTIKGASPGQKAVVIVNDIEIPIEFDKEGAHDLDFEKSTPQAMYIIRLKDDEKAQKIALWY